MFWDNLEQICRERGVSPYKVVQELGYSNGNVIKWKRGGGVTNNTIKDLSHYFGVPEAYWFSNDTTVTQDLLEDLRSDQRVLFDALKNATPQEIKQAVAIIYALKEANGNS